MHHLSRRAALGIAAASVWATHARAHGPTRLKVVQTVDIARSPDQVWAIVKDFDSIAKWHPVVASSPADKGNAVGSKRTLTLKAPGSPSFEEILVAYDAAERSYQYRIETVDPQVLPVNNYTAWFEVKEGPGGSTVQWRAAFYRGYMLNDPPPELNDDASAAAVTGVFRAGLDNIKTLAERAA